MRRNDTCGASSIRVLRFILKVDAGSKVVF